MEVYMYIPNALNFNEFNNVYNQNKKINPDQFIKTLNLLYELPMIGIIDKKGFVPLCQNEMKKNGIRDCTSVLRVLCESGILEKDNHYEVGKKCIGYRVTDKYFSMPVRFGLNRWQSISAIMKKQMKYKSEGIPYLNRWFNDKLSIDISKALAEMKHSLEQIPSSLQNSRDDAQKLFNAYTSCYRIHDKKFFYSVDNTSGRYHSNLTNLKKEMRKHITYDGKRLVSIDISNSQPFLLGCILKSQFNVKNSTAEAIFPIKDNYNNSKKTNKSITTSIMLNELTKVVDMTELARYTGLSSEGLIYDYVQSVHNKDGNRSLTRKEVKQKTIVYIYGDKEYNSTFSNTLSKEFPTIIDFVNQVRSIDHTILPIELQKIESYLILHKVCQKISDNYPNLPIFTIHDSVATLEGYEQIIIETIITVFENEVGIIPNLKTEYWK